MKLEENMDDIIAQLQNEGQVKVADEADLEKIKDKGVKIETKDLKTKDVDSKVIKDGAVKEQDVKMPAPKMTDTKVIEKVKEVKGNELGEGAVHSLGENDNVDAKASVGKVVEKAKKAQAATEAIKVIADTEVQKAEGITKVEEVDPVSKVTDVSAIEKKEEVKAIIEKVTAVNKEEVLEETNALNSPNTVVGSDKVESISEDSARLSTIGDFSGFKYVIHFSGTALAEDHDLFKNHDDLEILQTGANNFLYMIGDYASKVYANSGLPTIKKKYPEAYVIGFKKGKRVE